MGIPADTPDLTATPSIALGVNTASVLDMAEAYATLANHGRHGTFTMIDKITNGEETVPLPAQKTRQAISREAADTTTSVLQSVVQNGTATAALAAGRPAAGKTGTAEEDTAAWFAGYTPQLATVVSVMGQDPVTAAHKSLYGALGLQRVNGGGPPAQIWAQYTKAALKGKPAADFDLELQPGAENQAPSTQAPVEPSTEGQDNGGTTTGGDTGGQDDGGATQGQTQGQSQGQTQGQDNGGTTTGGDTTGGATGGTTTDGGATGGTTGDTSGGTTDGGTTGDAAGGANGDSPSGGAATGGQNPAILGTREE
jgi:membrane peptidoglycan carboxypeptidase